MNCIWITTDSFRQDHVHCYRPEGAADATAPGLQVQTPNIDALARDGVMFRRLRAEALPTVPCRRGFFTGRRVFPWRAEPPRKGMYITLPGWRPIPEEDVTVAEHLSARGWVTAMIADVYHLMKPAQNFHRGFCSFEWIRGQEYDQWRSQPLPEGYIEQFLRPGAPAPAPARLRVLEQFLRNHAAVRDETDFPVARTFRTAIEWLEQNHGHDKFFLYIDTFDPHEPWLVPRRFLDLYDPDWDGPNLIYGNLYRRSELSDSEHRHLRARYAAECTMVDYWLGKLLAAVDRLGLRERTLIVLVSDHGKIIGEFDHYGMPPQDTGPALNSVPCILRHPAGENAGIHYDGWFYNPDLTATVLELLGAGDKPMTDGCSVWPAVSGRRPFRDHLVTGHGPMIAVWEDDWLQLHDTTAGRIALYHLGEDPRRCRDVADRYPETQRKLRGRLEALEENGESAPGLD